MQGSMHLFMDLDSNSVQTCIIDIHPELRHAAFHLCTPSVYSILCVYLIWKRGHYLSGNKLCTGVTH